MPKACPLLASGWRLSWLLFLCCGLDQLSKKWITYSLSFGETIPIFTGFNLHLTYNEGIAFSMFNHGGLVKWVLSGVTIIVIVCLSVWLRRLSIKEKWTVVALNLILGGALGNLIDRLRFGHVIDFLDMYVQEWHWATFNLADAWICIGAGLLILDIFRQKNGEVVA